MFSVLRHGAYLAALLISLGGLLLLDVRYRLVWWRDWRRAAKTIASGLAVFLLWDGLGIGLGIFQAGQTEYATGVHLAPQFPLEELFFLILLVYLPLVAWEGWRRWRG